jgi:glycosyltransferase involved in cell wall biosynthesis
MKVALVHDWLTGMRGGEKCLEVLCELFPDATLYTLLYKKGSVSEIISRMKIKTSFVQKLPMALNHYQKYLPLFPTAIEQFDLSGYDLVISSSHCVAKGVITRPETCHICYCYTPMRYAWEMYDVYFNRNTVGPLVRWSLPFFMNYLRRWDLKSADRVDHFVAISETVRGRIQKHYHRDAGVIYPPADVNFYTLSKNTGDYFLITSALVPYKRVDLAILAFNELNFPLLVIGEGVEKNKLRKLAGGNIKFLDWQNPPNLKKYYSECRALIFPGEEDFGIVPVEAQACGKPVVAFGRGGVTESIKGAYPDQEIASHHTGIFFYPQTKESLMDAVHRFESVQFYPERIRENALRFDRRIFKEKIRELIEGKFTEYQNNLTRN